MPSFYLINFGCRASQADGTSLKRQLLSSGFEEAQSEAFCDLAVLNTCTVTAAADAEVRQVIRRIHRANPEGRILVTGCYAQRAPEEIAALPGVKWVVGNSHKHRIAEVAQAEVFSAFTPCEASQEMPSESVPQLIRISPTDRLQTSGDGQPEFITMRYASQAKILVGEIGDEFHFEPVFADDRTRPTLKVQDGCNARCSFCVIPSVRGRSRSLDPGRVVAQVRELEVNGYREIVLSGINLGGYGRDLIPRTGFLHLLERILGETSIPRIRISSIEPMDVTPKLIELAADERRLAKHFHIPLQSGCDRILRLMNRRYWAEHYAERILAIRERIPNCGIGADVMVGFPGETSRDHADSERFIESLPFTYLHIFPFSARPGTAAAVMPNPVDGRRARERSRELRVVIQEKHQAFLEAQVGRTLSVLSLDETAGAARLGLSSNYLRTAIPQTEVGPNVILDVEVARVHEGLLFGFARPQEPCASRELSASPCPVG